MIVFDDFDKDNFQVMEEKLGWRDLKGKYSSFY